MKNIFPEGILINEKVGFKIIDENIPAKFKETLRWARENNIEPIVMKYNN